jgi:hypothetical protein
LRNGVNVPDGAIGHEQPMFEIEVSAGLLRIIEELPHTVPVFRVNSLENQLERRPGFS